MNRSASLFLSALVALGGCGGSNAGKGSPMVADSPNDTLADDTDGGASASADEDSTVTTSGGADQGTEEGAQALLKQFVTPDADHAALTKQLRPTSGDYKAMFDAATAPKVEAFETKDWDTNKAVIKPAKANQTEVKVWSATGADLASGKGNAKEFPGGYKKVAKHLSPSVTFFRFKFVETGKDQGTAYDGLAFVNGHWVIAPKPWRAIDGARGGDDGDEPAEAAPAKPKPKGGKPRGKKR
jgi:hypothetical protein